MSTSFFDSTEWYRLSNDRTGVNSTLSLGYYPDSATPGPPDMTAKSAYSSENWQLFFQSGLYFIRNYDWGADWQLGVTANERSVPTMLQASGLLGMQWNVTQWSDGTFKVTNMLLGSNTPLFGVDSDSTIPTMDENEQGAHWAMGINFMSDGEKISDVALLQTLSSIETATKTSSQAAKTTLSSLDPAATISPSSNPSRSALATSSFRSTSASTTSSFRSTSNPQTQNNNPQPQSDSSSISSVAIAGIVISATAAVVALLALLFFLRRRRNITAGAAAAASPKEAPYSASSETEFGTSVTNLSPAFVEQRPVSELPATTRKEAQHSEFRAELSGESLQSSSSGS